MAGRLLFGPDYAWEMHRQFQHSLWARSDWPAFTVALAAADNGIGAASPTRTPGAARQMWRRDPVATSAGQGGSSGQADLVGDHRGLGASGGADLSEHAGDVHVDRTLADPKRRGDLPVGGALCQ